MMAGALHFVIITWDACHDHLHCFSFSSFLFFLKGVMQLSLEKYYPFRALSTHTSPLLESVVARLLYGRGGHTKDNAPPFGVGGWVVIVHPPQLVGVLFFLFVSALP